MYTFNRIDKRLDKLCELATFIFEAFEGMEAQFQYAVVGHSGTGPEALPVVKWGRPPTSAQPWPARRHARRPTSTLTSTTSHARSSTTSTTTCP